MLSRGEFDSFLVVIDAELGVVIFFVAVYGHHTAGIAGFDVMDAICGVVIIGWFELGFVVVDKTDGFVVTNEFNALVPGVTGNCG